MIKITMCSIQVKGSNARTYLIKGRQKNQFPCVDISNCYPLARWESNKALLSTDLETVMYSNHRWTHWHDIITAVNMIGLWGNSEHCRLSHFTAMLMNASVSMLFGQHWPNIKIAPWVQVKSLALLWIPVPT